jgi:glucarate dehydratase
MNITGAQLTVVDIPLTQPYVSSQSRSGKTSTPRTIVRLHTDAGIVGVGETNGTKEVLGLVRDLCERFIGHDVRDLRGLRRRALPNVYTNVHGRNGWIAFAGIEMACWDVVGKATGAPLWGLLGGRFRDRVPVAGLMSAFPVEQAHQTLDLAAMIGDHRNTDQVVTFARQLVDRDGFESLKIKSTGLDWRWDVAVMNALREAFGLDVELRLDPNAAFTVNEALRLGLAVRDLDLEYLEDPTRGIDAMARLRRDVSVPLATNMCVIDFEQLPVALRARAVDVILGDVYHWGGVLGFTELAAVCATFGIDMGIHSFVEAGIGAAVNVHLAAALPALNHAIDGMLHYQDSSIITEPLVIRDGTLAVPDGPGLGVTLNEEVIKRLEVDSHHIQA